MQKLKYYEKKIENEDNELWLNEVAGIKKMPKVAEKPEPPLIIGEVSKKLEALDMYSSDNLNKLEPGNSDNIDKHTAEKFKRGKFKIEATLDLHGMTEKQAFNNVCDFVQNSYWQKLRCILIVTGKGLNKDNDLWYEKKGILKECVPNWLNNPDLRPLILGISYAIPSDGGEGAIYVLLRRHRDKDYKKES